MKTHEFWDAKLREYIKDHFIDDLTDHNDSTCLTYFISADGNSFKLGSEALNAYLAEGNTAYYVKVQVSFKTDLMCIRFCKYEGDPTELAFVAEPATEEGKAIYRALLGFAFDNGVKIKRYGVLNNMMIGEESAYSLYFEPVTE